MSGLGAAALERAQQELAAGVCEVPKGSNTGPRVKVYLAGCVRGGHLLGLTAAEWCASFASWCVWEGDPLAVAWTPEAFAAPNAVLPPIGYRAAVAELVTDARHTGAWHDVSEIGPDVGPAPGDLLVFGRAGHDPRTGGQGHVAIVESGGPDSWVAIGGNQDDAVTAAPRSLRDGVEPLVGWISLA